MATPSTSRFYFLTITLLLLSVIPTARSFHPSRVVTTLPGPNLIADKESRRPFCNRLFIPYLNSKLCSENKDKFFDGNDDADENSLVGGDNFEGSVDWDAEWKKVVENRDQPMQRPGKYKSQAEIAAIKATNKVAKNVYDASRDMKANIPNPPSIRSLQGDWRFWIGILVIVSFGLSILSVTAQTQVNDSFYI